MYFISLLLFLQGKHKPNTNKNSSPNTQYLGDFRGIYNIYTKSFHTFLKQSKITGNISTWGVLVQVLKCSLNKGLCSVFTKYTVGL